MVKRGALPVYRLRKDNADGCNPLATPLAIRERYLANPRSRSIDRSESLVPERCDCRVGFKEESRLFTPTPIIYYQQRFNFIEPDDDLTLEQFLTIGFSGPITAIDDVPIDLELARFVHCP